MIAIVVLSLHSCPLTSMATCRFHLVRVCVCAWGGGGGNERMCEGRWCLIVRRGVRKDEILVF